MSRVSEIVDELRQITSAPAKSVRMTMEETGKPAVGCFPIYTPEELIYAAGAVPVGLWGGQTEGTLHSRYLPTFCCSVMRANTEQSLRGDYDMLSAVIVTAYCDTLKCITENWKTAVPHLNVIPFVAPQNVYSKHAAGFLVEEYDRIKKKLEEILDTRITEDKTSEAVDIYDRYRDAMRRFVRIAPDYPYEIDAVSRHAVIKAAMFMDKKIYTEKIEELNDELAETTLLLSDKKRIVLTGLMAEPDALLEVFDDAGLQVVADDLAQESRQFRVSAACAGSGLERMAERFLMQGGCSFVYDRDKSRVERLKELVSASRADAVVYCQMKFCDPDEFDYPIINEAMEEAGIPLLRLEIEQQMHDVSRIRTRVQSFAEMISL